MSSADSCGLIWINGQLIPAEHARVPVSDRGFLLGEGVFETLRSYRGEAFAVTRHWNRLCMGCEKLCISPPTRRVMFSAVKSTIESNRLEEARIRITVTRSSGSDPSMVVSAIPATVWPKMETVVVVPWTRNENSPLAGIKSLSYGENTVALSYARSSGAGEAVFGNTRGNLCEGSASNVFLVSQGRLRTPSLSSGCLPGVTRDLVLHVCREGGIEVFEEDVPLHALEEASEVFLTSSTREVHPVSRVNDTEHSPVPGPLSREIAERYRELTRVCKDP
jgi:branched-chain amino acid aminotransferase